MPTLSVGRLKLANCSLLTNVSQPSIGEPFDTGLSLFVLLLAPAAEFFSFSQVLVYSRPDRVLREVLDVDEQDAAAGPVQVHPV